MFHAILSTDGREESEKVVCRTASMVRLVLHYVSSRITQDPVVLADQTKPQEHAPGVLFCLHFTDRVEVQYL